MTAGEPGKRRLGWGSDDRPDLFNCGKTRGLLAFVGFLVFAVVLDEGFGLDGGRPLFYVFWAGYWLPVLWLMRHCLEPQDPSDRSG